MTDLRHLACSEAVVPCPSGCYGQPQANVLHGREACIQCNSPAFGDLVAMIGCAASGKSSALRTVPPHQIVSLDTLRAIVSEPGDQAATADAVLLQHHVLLNRARRGATTYVDNTSVEAQHRLQLVELAHQHGRRAVAVLVDAPLHLCLARNAARPDHQRVPEDVLRWQHRMARSAHALLPREGWDEIRHHPSTGH